MKKGCLILPVCYYSYIPKRDNLNKARYTMLKLTKSNVNFAAKHGIQLDINTEDGNVLFFVAGEEENLIEYMFNDDQTTLTFKFQVYGNKIEDLPAHITDTKQFNQVVKYIGSELDNI